jgi:hypothetical protein
MFALEVKNVGVRHPQPILQELKFINPDSGNSVPPPSNDYLIGRKTSYFYLL